MKALSTRSFLYKWFPVLPFLGYWLFSYLMFEFGLFKSPDVSLVTIVFVWICLIFFTASYYFGLEGRTSERSYCQVSTAFVVKTLKWSSFFVFVGTVLFLVDKFLYGAASVDAVVNDLHSVREDFAKNTSALTTLAVLPQSFKLIAFAAYFHCAANQIKIPRYCTLFVLLTLFVEVVNMVFSANRGALFWIAMYVLFYVVYCKRVDLISEVFSRRNITKKVMFAVFVGVSFSYFHFVAKNREVESTAIYRGVEASYLLKYPDIVAVDDYADLAGQYQIFYYVTHGFQYTDAILATAPLLNLDLVSPLGIRVEAQIERFVPGYVHPAKKEILRAVSAAGLSESGWASIFGASVVYFGIIGAPVFFLLLGYFSGFSARRYNQSNSFAWLLMVFTIYSSLNMSFDWILRNFDQYAAIFLSIYMLNMKSQAARLR